MKLDSTIPETSPAWTLGAVSLIICALTFGCSKSESDAAATATSGSSTKADSDAGHDHDGHDHDGHDHAGHDHDDHAGHDHGPGEGHEGHDHAPGEGHGASSLPDADAVAATVNGTDITEGEIERIFQGWVRQRSGGRPVPESQLAQIRPQIRPQILESLIGDTLMAARVKSDNITVSEEELMAEVDRSMQIEMDRFDISKEEIAKRTLANTGKDLDAYVAEQIANPDFIRMMEQTKLLRQTYPERIKVTDEEIAARYEQDKAEVFTTEAQVKASHILLKTDTAKTDEAKEEIRKSAAAILTSVKSADADFAELARKHSACSSASAGGDLGFFPRTGAMVEPFAKAAFDLEVGQVSDLVETQFGYHIIKVTERKGGDTKTLEEATPIIRAALRDQKLTEARTDMIAELRAAATVDTP